VAIFLEGFPIRIEGEASMLGPGRLPDSFKQKTLQAPSSLDRYDLLSCGVSLRPSQLLTMRPLANRRP
jgi:hypothetical protein